MRGAGAGRFVSLKNDSTGLEWRKAVMFGSMQLNAKIISLAALLIFLTCLVALVGYRSYSSVVGIVETSDSANALVRNLQEMRAREKNFIISKNTEYADGVLADLVAIRAEANRVRKELARRYREKMDGFLERVDEYQAAFEEFKNLEVQKNEILTRMQAGAEETLSEIEGIRDDLSNQLTTGRTEAELLLGQRLTVFQDANTIIQTVLEASLAEKEYEDTKKKKVLEDTEESINDFLDIIEAMLNRDLGEEDYISTMSQSARDDVDGYMQRILALGSVLKDRYTSELNITTLEGAMASVRSYRELFNEFVSLIDAQDRAEETMLSSVRSAETFCVAIQTEQIAGMSGRISSAKVFLVIGTLVSLLLGVIVAYLITQSIGRGINPVIQGLTDATDQVASGSSEVANASQTLAAGASEQAAGIEEISSSMEEMSSMTKQSAENAGQADQHMKEAKQVVSRANESMGLLSASIGEISQASQKTSKIIKTIDEIAFQTNLLALNAAVEAARAGEAGAGFAVVADEVRNLAMRAAEAARDTATLIESIVKQIQESTGLVDTTSKAFDAVTLSSEKVGALVAEIAASAVELSRGIDQVNEAISGVDQVIQQNAASAEESASASEEMSAQAAQMKEYVRSLIDIVGSGESFGIIELLARRRESGEADYGSMTAPVHEEATRRLPKTEKETAEKTPKIKNSREIRPHEVIPMDDDDFQDF